MKQRVITFITLVSMFFQVNAVSKAAPVTQKGEAAIITKMTQKLAVAEKAFKLAPKDSVVKGEYIRKSMALANYVLDAQYLSPKEKYPRSLRLYRAVLKVDPKNKDAKLKRDTIERIYKQMGRPIPK